MMHVNTDYFNAFIDDLQSEINDIEEQRDEYKSRMEDLECELKEANEAYEILLKENAKLKREARENHFTVCGAFTKIHHLYCELADKRADFIIERIVNDAIEQAKDEDEE